MKGMAEERENNTILMSAYVMLFIGTHAYYRYVLSISLYQQSFKARYYSKNTNNIN